MSRRVKAQSDRLAARVKVGMTAEEERRLKARAAEAGMDVSRYMRALLLADLGKGAQPRSRKFRVAEDVVHAVNRTYVQLKKLGTNVNQVAHQANAGLVAVSRQEALYLINAVQTTMSEVKGTMEKLVA